MNVEFYVKNLSNFYQQVSDNTKLRAFVAIFAQRLKNKNEIFKNFITNIKHVTDAATATMPLLLTLL
jgi:truncated hemoglobin YjbI